MHLPQNIKYLRKSQGITQEELGGHFNLSYTAVGKWERGENAPTAHILVALADFFSVSLDDLVKTDLSARPQVQGKDEGDDVANKLAELEAQVKANHERLMAGSGAEAYQEQLEIFKRQLIRRHPDAARDLGLID